MNEMSPCLSRSSLSSQPCVRLAPIALVVLLFLSSPAESRANILSWSGGGGADANWSNIANWGYVAVPANGDTLIFSVPQPNLVNTNNLANLILNQIRFVGAAGGYDLRGNAFTLTNHFEATNSAGANTIENNITLATVDQMVDVAASLTLSGALSGSVGITKTGAGALTLAGSSANTYAGTTAVGAGTLLLNKNGGGNSACAIPGSLVLSNNTIARLLQPFQLYSPSRSMAFRTTLYPGSVFDLNGRDEWLAQVSLCGAQITNTAGTLYLSGDITVVSNSVVNSSISGTLEQFAYGGAYSNMITNTGHAYSPDLVIRANISSSSTNALIKAGDGEVDLNGPNNTYAGATIVQGGSLWVDYTNGLGNTSLPAVVNSGGSLFLNTNAAIGLKPLVLNGNGYNYGALTGFGSNSWAGDVTLASSATISSYATTNNLTLSGAIGGPGAFTKSGAGTATLTGSTANTYGGLTTVASGTLLLRKSIANGAVPGNLDVLGTVRLGGSDQIFYNGDVMLEPASLFDFGVFADSTDTLRGSGSVTFGVNGYLRVGGNNGSSTFNGVMSGTGFSGGYTVGKFGAGTFTMNGNNTFTAGATRVWAGKLVINGSQPQIPAIVDAGASLGGSGTVGTIAANGGLAPGTSPGILTSSNVTFAASGAFNLELTGPNPGPGGYDQLNVRGTNILANASLGLNLAFTNPVAIGQKFTIINNDGSEPISGIFSSYPEGASYSQNGFTVQISYVGGTGNDMVLTLTGIPGAVASSAVSSGNGSGTIDPNECNYLSLVVTNQSGTTMTGISATLSSTTPNVAVTQPFSAYADAPAGGKVTNTTPFQISTTTNFVCGSTINLTLTVTVASHGSFTLPVVLSSGSVALAPLVYPVSVVTNIPDVGTIESTNLVAGFTGPLEKVAVSLWLTHPIGSDLTLSLVSPNGTTVTLVSATGDGANFGSSCSPDANRTTFDDAAATSITAGASPFVGTFRPQGSLASFINTTANGNWRLRITDSYGGSTGALRCWSLLLYPVTCTAGGGLCELYPNVVITSAMGPDTPTQPGLLTYNGVPSSCGVAKPCPGTTGSGPWPYNNYTFRNGPAAACITVTVENYSAGTALLATVYSGSYNPANSDKCINYLADGGVVMDSGTSHTFSFNVASNATFVLNLIASGSTLTPYKLTVSGGDCRPVLNITPIAANNVRLDWTTAAAGYGLEKTNAVGSGAAVWPPVPGAPAVINSRFVTTNSTAGGREFYRLHKP